MTEAMRKWAEEKATNPIRYPATDPKGKYADEEAEFWLRDFCAEVEKRLNGPPYFGRTDSDGLAEVFANLKHELLGG